MSKKNESVPNHVAIIPDGNRRWAKSKGLAPWEGHEEGAKNLEKIVRKAMDLGVRHVTFWGSSVDNIKKRPLREKRALLDIYSRYIKRLIESPDIHENQVKINVIGRWEEQFPRSLKNLIGQCLERTKNYKGYFLNLLLAYNGDDDMAEAVRQIVRHYGSKAKVTGKLIKANLMTRDLPSVDYLIRTGGEPHMSAGFMMWDIANSQLFFTEKTWPDFNEREFEKAVVEFGERGRRFGK